MDLNFTFSVDETNIILEGLGELAAKKSLGIIAKIKGEAEKQMKETPESKVPVLLPEEE